MKRFLLFVITAAIVLGPVSAEAKSHRKPSSCIGTVTVDYSHGRKVVDRRLLCLGKVKPAARSFSADTFR